MKRRWQIVIVAIVLIGLCSASYAALRWRGTLPQKAATGGTSLQQASVPFVPNREEETALISETMNDFADALISRNFERFYSTFSSAWKKQTTAAALAQAMQQFLPFGKEVKASVKNSSPYLNAPPSIDAHNVLTLQGFYRIEGTKMLFTLQYVYESSFWKLFGMNLEVK